MVTYNISESFLLSVLCQSPRIISIVPIDLNPDHAIPLCAFLSIVQDINSSQCFDNDDTDVGASESEDG